jgi:hypothetical protein
MHGLLARRKPVVVVPLVVALLLGVVVIVARSQTSQAASGTITTEIQIASPRSIVVDNEGHAFIGQSGRVSRLDFHTKAVTTIVGTGTIGYSGDNGPATSAQIGEVDNVGLDAAGHLYVFEGPTQLGEAGLKPVRRVRKVDTNTNVITTYIGDMGTASADGPTAMGVGLDGSIYVGWFNRVVKFPPGGGDTWSPFAGNGLPGDGFPGGVDSGVATSARLGDIGGRHRRHRRTQRRRLLLRHHERKGPQGPEWSNQHGRGRQSHRTP